MSGRLRAIAQENMEIVASGGYRTRSGREVSLAVAVAEATAGTRIYGPESVIPGEGGNGGTSPRPTVIEVTGESSTAAARRLAAHGPVAVLNFASARNPGGGYVRGAKAQEEALCRASALYETLLRAPGYYTAHREQRTAFYSDRVIHSPAVPVFRDDHGELLETPFKAGFLTCPAPNAGVIRRQEPGRAHEIPAALTRRAERVLEVAALHRYPQLVLGAWGCGVFQNDPAQVAEAFRGLLTRPGRFAGTFERVVFGILDRDGRVRDAFARTLGEDAHSQP
ncbi:TIGR02452 family protein [Streptomyces sp. NPDC012888]|uniref:TIGR02452 family protein n=1 Tax=Streptomyces sp. NPDC012888 TaxID=3364855 RepID=UPI0036780E3A